MRADLMATPTRRLRRALRVIARPTRAIGPVVVQPYRGYGSRSELFLIGRVFRQPTFGATVPEGTWRRALLDLARRFLRRGLADAALVARFEGAEETVRTDRDGYFRIHMRPVRPIRSERLWHDIDLELTGASPVRTTGDVFVPPERCRYVVISDIDDTVMVTGVANTLVMLWRLFMQPAESRAAFPGVAALLRALHGGVSGSERNPMLYVSRGPWSIYEVLDAFFNLHRIPIGPLLFLREWGLTLQRPLPKRAEDHKLDLIRNMLALYDDLPFVLIGDSGQHDPEIYARVVRENPGRVTAVYIRNVDHDPERRRAIEALAVEVAEAGSTLVLAADSAAMARHAAEHGLIAAIAVAEVEGERLEQAAEPPRPEVAVEAPTPAATSWAVAAGDVEDALGHTDAHGTPPTVVVEAEIPRSRKGAHAMEDLPRAMQDRADSLDPELRQRIEERAYALWEAEGRQEHRALEYWLRAEQEVGNESVAGEEDPLAGIDQETEEVEPATLSRSSRKRS